MTSADRTKTEPPATGTSTAEKLSLSADWVLPLSGPPLRDGAVLIEGDKILAVGSRVEIEGRVEVDNRYDFGHSVITPGLINLHSHLDYSAQQDVDTSTGLFDWIPQLMAGVSKWSEDDFLISARRGAECALSTGTTFIVDSSYTGSSAIAMAEVRLKGIVGLELFGIDEDRAERNWAEWQKRFEKLEQPECEKLRKALEDGKIELTVAPHAPYTVSPALWKLADDWARARGSIVPAHLAETEDEVSWLRMSDTATVDRFLRRMLEWRDGSEYLDKLLASLAWKGDGTTSVRLLNQHGLLNERLLAAHCIHLEEEEFELIRARNVAIAHCPRSNFNLKAGRARLEDIRKRGIRIGLGTDSLASNKSLSLFDEASFAMDLHREHAQNTEITAKALLHLMTADAALALRMDSELGTLNRGKRADIAVFHLPESGTENRSQNALLHLEKRGEFEELEERIAEVLIKDGAPTVAVYVDGQLAYRRDVD